MLRESEGRDNGRGALARSQCAGDLAVSAGWGHGGQGGVTMPGRGRTVERPYAEAEFAAFREGLGDLGLSYDQLTACLGGACYDVYLNDVAYWRCVTEMARRIAVILLLEPALDANYERVKADTYAWPAK